LIRRDRSQPRSRRRRRDNGVFMGQNDTSHISGFSLYVQVRHLPDRPAGSQ
jgi:hypothetical protein